MIKTRVIPVLLWDGINCVQTVQFGKRRVFGSLMDAVRVFDRRNVDELILLDISKPNRPRIDEIKEFTSQLFCPVTVGGGVRELEDIRKLLKAGADKVSIKTMANPEFISAASRKFGSQATVVALDIFPFGGTDGQRHDRAALAAKGAEVDGAGEILLTAVHRNGTKVGYDTDLIWQVARAVDIPVIAHGGCGKPEHMLDAIVAGAHAVAASTMFLFTETTPRECARFLAEQGVETRV